MQKLCTRRAHPSQRQYEQAGAISTYEFPLPDGLWPAARGWGPGPVPPVHHPARAGQPMYRGDPPRSCDEVDAYGSPGKEP